MDKNPLVLKLNKLAPGIILESRRFGRSSIPSIWIEAQAIEKIGTLLKGDPELALDWLENLSVVEFEKALVVTYFLRSSVTTHQVLVRLSVLPASEKEEICLRSVQQIWPMSQLFEQEIEEMFGICFRLNVGTEDRSENHRILPQNWNGYPLRKNYSFPSEYLGISHARSGNNRNDLKKSSQ